MKGWVNNVKKNRFEIDMCNGSIMDKLISFSLPLMVSGILQLAFNAVDIIVVGRFSGSQALAAVGSTTALINVFTNLFIGISLGANVLAARFYAAGKDREMSETVHTSITLALISGIMMAVIGVLLAKWALEIMGTPDDVIGQSTLYMRIYFMGMPFFMLYNYGAAILRAIGDTKRPLIFLIISGIANAALNMTRVILFHMGVAGAALATVIAQCFSALYCFIIVRKIEIVHITKDDFRAVPGLNRKLLSLGTPILFQDVIISLGGLAVQFVVNGYGFLFVAGFTATNKLYGILEMAAISYGYAIVTYVGQNLGAGQISRIKKGVHVSGFLAFLTSAFISVMMFIFGKHILRMFISGDPAQTEQVLGIAWHYLSIMASVLCILYFLYVYRSALQGLGDTMIPMLSGVVEFFIRVGVALLLPKIMGQNGIFYAEITAWTGAAVLLAVSYYIRIRKFRES